MSEDPSGEATIRSAESAAAVPETVRFVADAVVPCTGDSTVLRPGAVEVTGDTVVRVGTPARLRADGPDIREVRVDGALLPGFVNTHCHSAMSLFRGTGENLPLGRWLNEVLWPREVHLEPEDVYWGMTLAAAELLAFGVTTSCEMYFHEDANADAVIDAGSRGVLTPGVLQLPGSEEGGDWWTASLDRFTDFHARRHGEAGRIEVGFAAHAAYTVPLPGLVDTAAAARERDALFHLHLAETADEADGFVTEHGGTVPQVLADAGVFDGRVLAAHSIWLSTEDIGCYASYDVAVAHCPQSNAKLASGIAPVTDLLAAGVRVGLGTDGPASNNDLDLWEEMRLAALLARLRQGDAGAIPAAVALDLATRGAGAAIGRPDLGVLAPGAKADMMAVRLDDPAFVPLLDDAMLVEHLVWSASSRLVTDVWVAGAQVVSDGEVTTVDLDRARAEVGKRAARLADAGA
jgi:5-methylthioadenosine/S-adenosylhomocysteine deaminase